MKQFLEFIKRSISSFDDVFEPICIISLQACAITALVIAIPLWGPAFIFWYLFIKEDDNNER